MRKNRKMEILQTAMALFRQRSYDQVSVQDICDACGLSKKAFYYHYRAKEDLILDYFSIIDRAFDWTPLLQAAQAPDADYLALYWQYELYIVQCGQALGPDLQKILYRCDMDRGLNIMSPFAQGPYRNAVVPDQAVELLALGQRAGQIRADQTPQQLLFALFACVVGINFHWSSTGGSYDNAREIYKVYRLIMQPVQP